MAALMAENVDMAEQEQDFNWVQARADCSGFHFYQKLVDGVKGDVKTINNLRNGTGIRFTVDPSGEQILVSREGEGINDLVRFTWSGSVMCVTNRADATILEGSLTLNDEGQCRLKVGEKELTFWQFRKRALEGLFFNFRLS
jgi:hypothetical protein